jgi:hypothetical protein
MSAPVRRATRVLIALCGFITGLAAPARAQEVARASDAGSSARIGGAFERIDDPKLERRLGMRVELAWVTPPGAADGGAAFSGSSSSLDATRPVGYAERAPAAAVVEASPSPRAAGPSLNVPRLKLSYRHFTFVHVAVVPAGTPSRAGGSEAFHNVGLEFYPLSSFWRLGLSAAYGWEDGTFRDNGDALLIGGLSLGVQLPGPTFTPFIEALAAGGLMQRTHAGLNAIASGYGQLGFDVGAELFLARYAFVSAAVGYLHGVNGFVQNQTFATVSADMWSFKLGFGL